MNNANNDLIRFKDFLLRNEKSLAIYGTGEAGRVIWNCVRNYFGFEVKEFVDREKGVCCGVEVMTLNEISNNTSIIIAANPEYKIQDRFENSKVKEWVYIDPVFLNNYCKQRGYIDKAKKLIEYNEKIIERTKNFLADSFSKNVYEEMIFQRVNPQLARIQKYYDKGQYFGNDIVPEITGNFVDCGAYTGDTLMRFINQVCTDNWYYYAFEGNRENVEEIKRHITECSIEDKVSVYNNAVWEEKTTLYFENPTDTNEMTSGRVSENNLGKEIVEADSLDHMLMASENAKPIDIITMDIEGAEIKALKGAVELIKQNHPILAISIYHEISHLWEIPQLIHEIDDDYKLFIRHHRWNIADTVCYGIWEEK